jgi:tRNA-dihydrouridine synthase
MIGREAYHNPWFLAEVEQLSLWNAPARTALDIARKMMRPISGSATRLTGSPIHSVTRHMLDLVQRRSAEPDSGDKNSEPKQHAPRPLTSFMEDVLIQMDKKISSETAPPEGI